MDSDPAPRADRDPASPLRDEPAIAAEVAAEIHALIDRRRVEGRHAVLGLATGSTPTGVYRELLRRRQELGLDLDGVVAVNLDEYLGLAADDPRTFRAFMRRRLFDAAGWTADRIVIPRSDVELGAADPVAAVRAHCREIEERIAELGGIDLQVLGIGRNGHVAFNEPGSGPDTRVRRVELHSTTRADAARDFGRLEDVPTAAITLGVANLLEARRLRVLAFGAHKRDIVLRTLRGSVGPEVPATWLRDHPDVRWYFDADAAAALDADADLALDGGPA